MKIQENEKTIYIYPFVDQGKEPVWADGAITVTKDEQADAVSINCRLDVVTTKAEWQQFKAAVDKAFEIRETLLNANQKATIIYHQDQEINVSPYCFRVSDADRIVQSFNSINEDILQSYSIEARVFKVERIWNSSEALCIGLFAKANISAEHQDIVKCMEYQLMGFISAVIEFTDKDGWEY